jgi:hypothetical protein
MTKIINFDVLIVYTETLTASAADTSGENNLPFPKGSRSESYNTVYGYFLDICRRNGLSAALTTSADIIGAGQCSSFWTFQNKKWIKNYSDCFSELIFDKFSPTRRGIKSRRKLLFSTTEIKSFNDPELFNLFFDKQKTYDKLAEFSIPTISLGDCTIQGVETACNELKNLVTLHSRLNDFSQDIVMKDRFGAGGRRVYKFSTQQPERIMKVLHRNPKISFIIQPFAKFDKGFTYKNSPASTDVRFIYLNGKIAQTYIRVAKQSDFRCNEHQGGSLIYLTLKDIPKYLIEKSNMIAEKLDKKCSLYALDFIVSNNGNTYLLEGNTGPGLDWNMSLRKNEIEAKKLIRLVVKELVSRVETEVDYEDEIVITSPVSIIPQLIYPALV